MKHNSQINAERLLKFGKEYLSEAFPNPDRIGCPSEHALRLAAFQPQDAEPGLSEHLTCCSPCFNRYMGFLAELQEELRHKQPFWKELLTWPKTAPLWAGTVAVAAIVLTVGAYFAVIQNQVPRPPLPPPPGTGPASIAYSPFILDLRELSPTRAPTVKGHQARAVHLPRKPLDMFVVLPIGSEEGAYQLSLNAKGTTVWTERAQAHLVEHNIILQVKLDLAKLPAGTYEFQVETASGFFLRQPVAFQNSGAEPEGKQK
ncbi:MAG: hypothetical protein L0338_33795 [Acidobacteria bacterium]|nr:hypothetical protein [Acidobacteriota bacterium]